MGECPYVCDAACCAFPLPCWPLAGAFGGAHCRAARNPGGNPLHPAHGKAVRKRCAPLACRQGNHASESWRTLHVREAFQCFRAVVCARKRTSGRRVLSQTLDRLPWPCPLYGIPEDAQGSPGLQETLTQSFMMPLIQEATVGLEPTNEGFADPCLTTWLRRPERQCPS